jgi:hypothetical protein
MVSVIPQNAASVLITLGLVVPGVVYQGVRRRLRGPTPEDRDLSVRVLRAFTASAALALVYLASFGQTILELNDREGTLRARPRLLAVAALVALFVVPASLAAAGEILRSWRGSALDERFRRLFLTTYDPTPTAWDYCFTGRAHSWVRVLTVDGRLFRDESYASSYPEPRELFVEVQYRMEADGTFLEAIPASAGVYIRCDDIRAVEFLQLHGDEQSGTIEESEVGHERA